VHPRPHQRSLDEPRFFIALPEDVYDFVPRDATKLLNEWERGLDPAQDLRNAASWWLVEARADWVVRDHMVAPGWPAVMIVREAGRDVRLLATLEASDAQLYLPGWEERFHEPKPRPVSSLVDRETGLSSRALPLLYGLAVLWAAWSGQSYYAREAMRQLVARTASDRMVLDADRALTGNGGGEDVATDVQSPTKRPQQDDSRPPVKRRTRASKEQEGEARPPAKRRTSTSQPQQPTA
jgi:hypothetical protein